MLCEVRNSKDKDFDNPKPHLATLEVKLLGAERYYSTCIRHLGILNGPYEVRVIETGEPQ